MDSKAKYMIIGSILVALVTGGATFALLQYNEHKHLTNITDKRTSKDTKDNKTDSNATNKSNITKEDNKINDVDKKEENTNINNDNQTNDKNNVAANSNKTTNNKVTSNTSKPESSASNNNANTNQNPSSGTTTTTPIPNTPTSPIEPEINEPPVNNPEEVKPVEPSTQEPVEQEVKDLLIEPNMLVNNAITLNNKTYNSITLSPELDEKVNINLENVNVESLNLSKTTAYTVNVKNSKLNNVLVAPTSGVSMFSLNSSIIDDSVVNTSIRPILNIDNTEVNTIEVNGNIEINGNKMVPKIDIKSGGEVVVNIPSESVLINTIENASVTLSDNIKKLVNQSSKMNLIVNANVEELTNKGMDSNIRINTGKIVKRLSNEGENTVVSGSGTINNLNVFANNTLVYANVTEIPSIASTIENVLVRKENNISIEFVKSTSQSSITFALSEDINLKKEDISIICNAGKHIATYNLTKIDDKTYTLTTSYFKNNSYELYVTLPNGNIISKDFSTDYANPTVNNEVITRTDENSATLELFGVDEGGYLYYILEPITNNRESINESYIKEKGKMVSVKTGYNKVEINNLKVGEEYNLYYVIEGFYHNTSSIKGPLTINSEFTKISDDEYKIISAKEEIVNQFIFKLNKPLVDKVLTLKDFNIICPTGKSLTLSSANLFLAPDGVTYIITIPNNYGHLDNNYTVEINIGDGKILKSNFVVHFNPPHITNEKLERTNKDILKLSINSDEAGTIYYGFYEWNGGIYDYNSSTPFAKDVLLGKIESKKQNLIFGLNEITLDLTNIKINKNTRVWALYVDDEGNYRTGFVDHYGNIPEYIEKPEEEQKLRITKIESAPTSLKVYFSDDIKWLSNDEIFIQPISTGNMPKLLLSTSYDNKEFYSSIDILNTSLDKGAYNMLIMKKDSSGKIIRLEKQFEIK